MSSLAASAETIDHSSLLILGPKSATVLRKIAESPKLSGITSASHLAIRPAPEMASIGIPPIDNLTGGIPRGCLTEICGPGSSGRTSTLLSTLAEATRREEVCTLIDVSDAFDPHSAATAGVNMQRLLWIRCGLNPKASTFRKGKNAQGGKEWQRQHMADPLERALRAADLLLQSSGFGLVAIDLAGVPGKIARRIPLTTWFRFRRAVENTPTILLVIGEQMCAQSCASLSLQLENKSRKESFLDSYSFSSPDGKVQESPHPSHAVLLNSLEIHAEMLRSCAERKPARSATAVFHTKAPWTGTRD